MGTVFTQGLDDKDDKEDRLFKRLKNIAVKSEEQLKVHKDQSEKQPIMCKVKNPNFNNVSFRNLLGAKSIKVFKEIRDQDEIIDYSRPNFIGSSKKYTFNFENFIAFRKSCRKYLQW